MSVLTGCTPRPEVLQGDLEDAIFAADFGDLIAEDPRTPRVYRDARAFFEHTHPARDLRTVVQAVFRRLADPGDAGAVVQLSTGFGGGKTHTLMTLWHLARHVGDASLGTDLLPAAGRPGHVTVVAVDASKAGWPTFLRHGAVEVRSLQGEIAWQLGAQEGVRRLGAADAADANPAEASLAALFPERGPVLLLLDELVVYAAALSDQAQANVLNVVNKLMAITTKRPQTVLVITDPGNQPAYAATSAQQRAAMQRFAVKLDDLLGRRTTDFDPIGNESAQVIVRRLFERVDPAAAQRASATYHALYGRVAGDHPELVPPGARTADYARRIAECYPFHPRLLDTARDRLGALEDFQKSRGVLRLFARILRDVWERRQPLDLVTAGDLDWSSTRIRGDLLQRLNRESFLPAVTADVESHAGELDGGPEGVHRRAATALLLESLPLTSSSGLTPDELTLAVLRPDEAGPEPAEALDRLAGVCWHTYPLAGGRGWQFRYDPNVIKQIEQRRVSVPLADAEARVMAEAQSYFAGAGFKVAAWPERASQVRDVPDLQLALCRTEATARAVVDHADDDDPHAPTPRRYRNALVAVTARGAAFDEAVRRAQGLIAAQEIARENKSGEHAKTLRLQLERLLPDYERQFRLQTRRAFDRVLLAGNQTAGIDERYQGDDDSVLKLPSGQAVLRRFLDAKELIYRPDDALDAPRFVAQVLPGAVPSGEVPGAWTARAVYERVLGAPGLRLVMDEDFVRRTLARAVRDGKLVVRTADGRAYAAGGVVEGAAGQRRRRDGHLTTFALGSDVLVAPAGTPAAQQWLAEDAPAPAGTPNGATPGGATPPPPPPPAAGPTTAHDWDRAAECATERALTALTLTARTPAAAQRLAALAPPFGADALALEVQASGDLRTGGTVNYYVSGVKPSHPVRPLETASLLANALGEGALFEASLALTFAGGRGGLAAAFRQAAEQAPDGLTLAATFAAPATASPAPADA